MSLTNLRPELTYKSKANPTPSTLKTSITYQASQTTTPTSTRLPTSNMNPTLLALILAISAVSVSAAPIPLQDVVEDLVSRFEFSQRDAFSRNFASDI